MIPNTIIVEVTFIGEGNFRRMKRALDNPNKDISTFVQGLDTWLDQYDVEGVTKPGTTDL